MEPAGIHVQRPYSVARPGAMAEDSGQLVTGTVNWFSVIKGYGARGESTPAGLCFVPCSS